MKNTLYTLDEAQIIGSKIIKKRSEELQKDFIESKNTISDKKDFSYV